MKDVILDRNEIITFYRNILGKNWINYGLEIVKTADSVLLSYEKRTIRETTLASYASKALYYTILGVRHRSHAVNNRESSLEDLTEIRIPSTKINTDYCILIADMEKKLTPDVIYVGLRTYLDGYSREDFVRKTYFTDNMVRGRLKKFNDYIEQYGKER